MKKAKIIVILGQTATGKSSLAVRLAKKFKGEVISADSRQVYRGLNIGTGKITKKEMLGVPHYLLDVVNPKNKFAVSEYKKLADKKIKEIINKGKIPIICGGTGFYIDALVDGIIFPEVPPDLKLRKKLEKKSTIELFKILSDLDQSRAKTIDHKNKVRLVRAIEIAKALGKVPSLKSIKSPYQFIKIGLKLDSGELEKKIEKRVKEMFKNGLLKEIRELKKNGLSDARLRELGFEYFVPTEEKVIRETIKYSRRQMTWFKRDKKIKWFTPSEYKKIESYLKAKL